MATVSELIRDIADVTGERHETVNAYARALIDADLLPKSKGRAIAQVDLVDVLRLLAAVALEPKIKNTAETVSAYMNETGDGVHDRLIESVQTTAEEFLIRWLQPLFSEPETEDDRKARARARESEISFVRTWREIEIRVIDTEGEDDFIRFKGQGRHIIPGHWNGYIKNQSVISGMLFVMLGDKAGRDYVAEFSA